MASNLRDIPGANRRTPPLRRRRSGAARPAPPILIDPRATLYDRGRPSRGPRRAALRRPINDRRRRIAPVDLLLATLVIAIVGFLGSKLWSATRVDVQITGIEDGGAVTFDHSAAMDVTIKVNPTGKLRDAKLRLDGEDLADRITQRKSGFHWLSDKPLTAGMHHLVLTVPRPILPAAHFTWDFLVDAVPPQINVGATLLEPVGIDDPVTVKGKVSTDATLTANGDQVEVADDGAFRVRYDRAPAGPINLTAIDKAGQTTVKEIFVPIKRPMTRGVHMSAISWRQPDLRDAVLAMADAGTINTVELDIKDESGEVGWNATVPLARQIGAVKKYYDLGAAVKDLHARGIRVIGRVVAFRDPILAQAAWFIGNHDWVIQDGNGKPLGAYGGFTNFKSPEVRKYNIDLAMEAVDLGVDEILWDYVRRPEDKRGVTQVIPGLGKNESVETAVAAFLTQSHEQVRRGGALQGASVFGVAAQHPETVGQSVPLIAKAVDYISPMVYPSLWVPGEYRVPDPPHMPYDIVTRSLQDFQNKTKGTGVTLVPWLQDFSLGANYGDSQVRDQVAAASGLDIQSYLLWSPRVRYHVGLLQKI
jgi:hypothetical protein